MILLKMKNKILLLFILITIPALTFSQEIVTGLYTNPAIKSCPHKIKDKAVKSNMLTIPFFDDFSGTDIYPNVTLWADKNVFINSSYPYLPTTIGVATFDALNDTGALYPDAGSSSFIADSFTSNPIRLDSIFSSPAALTIADSLYFSFYYQPQGTGNAPETDDSLVLEFYSPKTNSWNEVWSSEGMTLSQFHSKYNVWFKQVLIPITDSVNYFHKDFRFRFYNYASLANSSQPSWACGNVDIWNIDYVYLNKGRNMADSIYKDVAFVEPAPSVLKNYYSMPWTQFNVNPVGEMKDTFNLVISNLDSIDLQINYKYNVFDEFGNILLPGTDPNTHPTFPTSSPFSSNNILAFSVNQFTYGPPANILPSKPPVDFTFPPTSADSATFTIVHRVKEPTSNLHNENDSIFYIQKFYNYYAYDDGVPEAGYGLDNFPNGMVAYKFTLNHPDTLRAVNMFFNQTLNNASQKYFYLTIWNDASGYPGSILYQKVGLKPEYENTLNKYYTYKTDDATLVLSGTFYVGWKQLTGDNLNLGFDMNADQHTKTFYNIGSGWMNSSKQGALMIRPLFGKALVAGINEQEQNTEEIKVFPNPSNGKSVSVILSAKTNQDNSKLSIRIFDLLGNEVYNHPFSNTIDASFLQNGMYLMTVSSNVNDFRYFTRLVIVK